MEWYVGLMLFIGAVATFITLRVPVALAMLGASMGGAVLLFGFGSASSVVTLGVGASIMSFGLAPVPLFVLMGEILFRAKIAENALSALRASLPRVPAQLAVLSTVAGAVLGAVSGSPLATTALLGNSIMPEMRRLGYNPRLAAGAILCSGGLAMIIPPSTTGVVLGATAGIPVGPLLVAGIVPGVLMATGYLFVTISWYLLDQKKMARRAARVLASGGTVVADETQPPSPEVDVTQGPAWLSLVKYVLPLGFIIFTVVGLIMLGVATPTESAATGVIGAAIMALAYRAASRQLLTSSLRSTTKLMGAILLIVASAGIFSQVMSASGIARGAITFLVSFDTSTTVTLIILLLTVVFLGFFLEAVAMILITTPFFMPVISSLGVDPLWFGIMWLIAIQIGLTTPPFGMSLFVMKRYLPDASLKDLYTAAIPYVISDVTVIALLFTFPGLVTWLPNLAFG